MTPRRSRICSGTWKSTSKICNTKLGFPSPLSSFPLIGGLDWWFSSEGVVSQSLGIAEVGPRTELSTTMLWAEMMEVHRLAERSKCQNHT